MHIHQGHWSLSSSAWWTLLCNNQLIYILPSTAICVDYWEKAKCVCVCVCLHIMLRLQSMCAHFPLSFNISHWKLDELIWHTVLLDVRPNIGPSCLSSHTQTRADKRRSIHTRTHACTHTMRECAEQRPDFMCACSSTPITLFIPLPHTYLSGGQFLAPILSCKPSWVARLCVVKNVRPSVPPPCLCRAIFKGSKVWRHRLAAWQPCPRIPTLCQPWTGTITWARLTNMLAVHVPFSCLICASQRQRNSLRNFTWHCFVILSGYS